MHACRDDLDKAHEHLRHAARALHERVLGKDVVEHLRHAAKNMLQAGIHALDEADKDCHKPNTEHQTDVKNSTSAQI